MYVTHYRTDKYKDTQHHRCDIYQPGESTLLGGWLGVAGSGIPCGVPLCDCGGAGLAAAGGGAGDPWEDWCACGPWGAMGEAVNG